MHELHWRCEALQAAERKAEEGAKRVERITEEGVERAQRMIDKVEKIVKGVEDRAERFFRSMPRPEFPYDHDTQQGDQPGQAHQTHHESGNHHHGGPAPATTIYHHYHHGQSAATDTSTAIVTSTAVTTSTSTITCVTLTATTTIATATTTAFPGAATRPEEDTLETVIGPAGTPGFWILGAFLLIYSIALWRLLKYEDRQDSKTKPPTEPKPNSSSLTQLDFDLTSLKPYITTPNRQIFAVTICRIVAALYCLESYWAIKTTWNSFTWVAEDWRRMGPAAFSYVFSLFTPAFLVIWCVLGYHIYIVLDLPFTFVSELALMPVSADANPAPISKGNKRPKKEACKGKKSTESGSEEGWQTDLHG